MNSGKTIFAQLMEFLPTHEFRKCVKRYNGNYKIKSFSCWDQFLCMAFAQLTYRESLRDIQACLRAFQQKLYHMGIRGKASRNTLAHANQVRDWRIYADFAQVLIGMVVSSLLCKCSFRCYSQRSPWLLITLQSFQASTP
jgi:hypothetical protein